MRIVSSVSVVAGLALLYGGINSLYGSHVKKGAGGKSATHGLTLLLCGALFIGLPYTFDIVSSAIWGGVTSKIGETGDSGLQKQYADIIGQPDQM